MTLAMTRPPALSISVCAKRMAYLCGLFFLAGCCSVPAHVPFECPDRFEFAEYSQELWASIPMDAQTNISDDDLNMKEYIKSCEVRMEIHND